MQLRSLLLLFLFALSQMPAYAQAARHDSLKLRFSPAIGNKVLTLYNGASSDSLRITMFRCYISGISLWQDNKAVWREANSYHLLDAAQPETMQLLLRVPVGMRCNGIRFMLGIDSATSSSGAHSGDLDPANGMYWAWQSGYVNFKLEGVSPQSTARKHQFHFHLGGYQQPFAAVQEISLPAHQAEEIVVKMDLDAFLSGIDLAKQNSIMIPGEEAFFLSKKAVSIFKNQ